MKIDIAKEDLWWLRESLAIAIRHMESQPNPSAFSKTPHVARKIYKKIAMAMKGWGHDKFYFPKVNTPESPGSPIADELERSRSELNQQRTPAYGDALSKLREAEKDNVEIRNERDKAVTALMKIEEIFVDYMNSGV